MLTTHDLNLSSVITYYRAKRKEENMEYLLVFVVCGVMAIVGVVSLVKETNNFKREMRKED